MSVKDIIKSSVYENFGGATGLSVYEILIILTVACIIGAYIFYVYKYFAHSQFYSKDFNITLIGMTIVVAAIMIAMQSNLLVSLGMVGALSIVRFRTAVKSPLDLLYMFWAISAGIICGVGLYILAIVMCVIMTIALWLFGKVPASKAPGLLVIRMEPSATASDIENEIKANSAKYEIKSTSIKGSVKELICEIQTKNINELIDAVNKIDGVSSVNYLEHSGEFRG